MDHLSSAKCKDISPSRGTQRDILTNENGGGVSVSKFLAVFFLLFFTEGISSLKMA